MEVDAVLVGLPDLDESPFDCLPCRVEECSAHDQHLPPSSIALAFDRGEIAVAIGWFGSRVVGAFLLARRRDEALT